MNSKVILGVVGGVIALLLTICVTILMVDRSDRKQLESSVKMENYYKSMSNQQLASEFSEEAIAEKKKRDAEVYKAIKSR